MGAAAMTAGDDTADTRDEVDETDDGSTTRRGLLKKGLVGAGAVGAVWAAPRIEGLSVRPDYAAAQSFGFGTPPQPPPGGFSVVLSPLAPIGPGIVGANGTGSVPLSGVGSGYPGTFQFNIAWVQNAPGPLVGTLTLTKGTGPHPPDDCGFITLFPNLNNFFNSTVGTVLGTTSVTSGQIVANGATITTPGAPPRMTVTGFIACL